MGMMTSNITSQESFFSLTECFDLPLASYSLGELKFKGCKQNSSGELK